MWSRSRAPSAGSRSSTTRSRPPAAPRRWCRSTCATPTASRGSALALNERYQRLDVLVGNAGVLGPTSPLGHVEPAAWDEVMAVNVTANFHLIRTMDPLLRAAEAGRAVFVTSGAATNTRAYRGPYSISKAALDALARTYAAETVTTNVRVNLLNPGPTRTRMRAALMPGEDPMTRQDGRDGRGEDRGDVPAGFPGDRQALRLRPLLAMQPLQRMLLSARIAAKPVRAALRMRCAGTRALFPVQKFQDRLAHDELPVGGRQEAELLLEVRRHIAGRRYLPR